MSIYDRMPPPCPTEGCTNVRSPMMPLCSFCSSEQERESKAEAAGKIERQDRANQIAAQIRELERETGRTIGRDFVRLRAEYYALTGTHYIDIDSWRARLRARPDE